ncbi:MAG TPA: sigma-54 dependent transcriptional regulator [Candidatus Krumholzibacteria bacterium]|nr:sigma-54 dependent transcriptional regulator [Candidatus Krumholzibacteria bacterium]
MPRILIVDDEANIRRMLSGVLRDEGYDTEDVSSGEEALKRLQRAGDVDAVLLDLALPGMDGLATLKAIRAFSAPPIVLMMSGHGTIESAVQATKMGALDFLEKPLDPLARVLIALDNALRIRRLEGEKAELLDQLGRRNEMLGDSPAMQRLRDEIRKAGASHARILVLGANGTGKELAARAIHAISPRAQKPFVRLNCAAIPRDLIESELFGHEKGAFTGAMAQKLGKFELARGGTLFLDEVGDMSLETQAKLLRVLEENEMERVGGTQAIALDARVVAATNKNLTQEIGKGNFREDLYFRLAVITLRIPPLKDRGPDIVVLAESFLRQYCDDNGRRAKSLTPAARALLAQYEWPGNVRELRNMMERIVIMHDADSVDAEHLQSLMLSTSEGGEAPSGTSLRDNLDHFERRTIEKALAAANGNIAQAARALGLDRANLHRKLRRFGLVKGKNERGEDDMAADEED